MFDCFCQMWCEYEVVLPKCQEDHFVCMCLIIFWHMLLKSVFVVLFFVVVSSLFIVFWILGPGRPICPCRSRCILAILVVLQRMRYLEPPRFLGTHPRAARHSRVPLRNAAHETLSFLSKVFLSHWWGVSSLRSCKFTIG